MQKGDKYYAPYLSDSDTGYSSDTSDSSGGTDDSEVSEGSTGTETSIEAQALNGPDYREFASALQLTQAAAPSFTELETVTNRKQGGLNMAPYTFARDNLDALYVKKDPSGADIEKTIDFAKQTITSIIMLDSRDRDKKIYPQPTNLTLRLPRPYKNITNFQIIQIKLLSSFFYFRADKNNITITIHEQGRYLPPGATSGPLNAITATIREGTYNINTLISELTTQLNRTPIFYDFTGGFSQFAALFASTGDYSLNFNQPGDNYYDALNNQFIANPTMTQIVQKYFQTLNAGLSSYTLDQIKVAYYYPVLKEIILDKNYPPDGLSYDIPDTSALLPTETVRSRCIYTFQGINDPIVLQMVNLNVTILDSYRLAHTFRFALINRYTISVQSNNNRVTITSSQLNTSLTNLLNGKYNQYLAEQLQKYNITQAQYNTLSGVNALILAILTDMYYYLQKQFAIYFGINFNSYSLPYFTEVMNQIPVQNALYSSGISSNYDAQVIAKNISPQANNELSTFRTQPSWYWNRLNSLSTTINGYYNMNQNSTITSLSELGRVWNNILDARETSNAIVLDTTPFNSNTSLSTATIYQNKLLHYADIVTDIEAGKYTTFRFKSPVRQTLRVSAFPRPDKYRYPAYNPTVYDADKVQVFDNSYAFIENTQNSRMDVPYATSNLITLPGFDGSSTYFGSNFNTFYNLWTSNVNLNLINNRTYFTFRTPKPPSASTAIGYTYNINVSIVNGSLLSNFAAPIQVFLYHDRAAFMADISDVRNEKPLHYIQSGTYSNTTIATLNLSAYSQQTYYVMVRSKDTTFTAVDFRVVAYYPDGTSYTSLTSSITGFNPLANPLANLTNYNYASIADSNFIRLPINGNGTNSNDGYDSNFSVFSDNYVKMGYDSNGVSTDLTDYIGYGTDSNLNYINPKSLYRIDPITGYIFQANTAYDSNAQQYFGSGSLNQLFTSNVITTYTPTTVPARQATIAQYYDGVFMAPLPTEAPVRLSSFFSFDLCRLDTITSNLGSFTYNEITTLPGFINSNGDIDLPFTSNFVNAYYSNLTPDNPLLYQNPFSKNRIAGYQYKVNPTILNNYLSLGNGISGISLVPDDGVWDVNKIMLKSQYNGETVNDPNRDIKYLGIYIASYVNTLSTNQISLSNAYMVMELSTAVTYNANTSNFGFATQPGTYYEWVRSKNYIPTSNQYIYGYAQQISSMNTDSNAFYTILPFKSDGTLTTYIGLSGTPSPYFPYYSYASTNTQYLDGNTTPEGKGIVYPVTRSNPDLTRGPPTGGFPTQAKYEQSIPITNSVLQYQYQQPLYSNASSMSKFGPSSFSSNVGLPTFADSVFRVDGYAMFNQGGTYDIYEVKPSSTDMVYKTSLTADMFGTSISTPQLVGVSGNESEFAFLTMETRNITPNTGGFPNENEINLSLSNNIFNLSNVFTGPRTIIELPAATIPLSVMLNQITGQVIPAQVSTGITSTSNFQFTASNNSFDVSFMNNPGTASILGFLPKVYTAPSLPVVYTLISPSAAPSFVYLVGGTIPSPLPPVPLPATNKLLVYSPIPFTIDFNTALGTAQIFGFDLSLYTATLDVPSGAYYLHSPNTVATNITDIFRDSGTGKISIVGNAAFSVDFTADVLTGSKFGFAATSYSATAGTTIYQLTSPHRVNTDIASTFAHRFEIDTFNPTTGLLKVQDILTSSNAFYFPPLPSNWSDVMPTYPTYLMSDAADAYDTQVDQTAGNLYLPGTYSATITNIDSFNYTNKGGYSFGYTITYSGLSKIASVAGGGGSKSTWPPYEWWGASKASTIIDQSTYPYITQPRYLRNNTILETTPTLATYCNFDVINQTSRQKYFDVPNNPFGNFHLGYFVPITGQQYNIPVQTSISLIDTKYNYRDYIPGTSKYTFNQQSNFPVLIYADFTYLSTNTVVTNTNTFSPYYLEYPLIQPWGFDPTNNLSTLSTLVQSNVYPKILNVNLINKTDETNALSSTRLYGAVNTKAFGYEQQFIVGYDFYDIGCNSGVNSNTYYQMAESRITINAGYSIDYLLEPAQQVIKSYEGSNLVPYDLKTGAKGGFWITFNENNRIPASNTSGELTLQYASVWGNRNNIYDNPTTMKNAYQIFYPTQRIVMTKIKRAYDPITDLSGILYPEWPHTNMFAYDNYTKFVADISSNKWGLEKSNNFMVSDTNFSGYYYNAACLDVPLLPSSNYYYLAVRGYTPTEKSQIMMRFSLPNVYDYGYTRFTDLSNEIFMYPSSIGTFNSNYGNMLLAFNSNFVFDSNGRVFGSNIIQGFNGSNFSNIAGFGDFLQKFIGVYGVYNSNIQLLSSINSAVQANINTFITTDLQYILPPNALSRQRYTDPIIYSILWKTALPPQYLSAEDNWGLGWNLGYDKVDTPYDTTHVAQSFYKILDDYINLKLNPEFDMNRMDTGAKEDLSATNEPTGSIKAYYAKLLLASFGSYAQTIISNPITFQLPIPRIEKLSFTWTDTLGNTINNADCEWNVVIQMVESLQPGRPNQPPLVLPQ